MEIYLLFRKRTSLADDGLPWLNGSEEHSYTAVRNSERRGSVSAILVRSLLSVLDGNVISASSFDGGVEAVVKSTSRPGAVSLCWLDWNISRGGIPHGDPRKITYHLGVLAMLDALSDPVQAKDLWKSYASLLEVYRRSGRSEEIKEALCRAADELYYFLRYKDAAPEQGNSRLEALVIGPNENRVFPGSIRMDLQAMTDPEALRKMLEPSSEAAPVPVLVAEADPWSTKGFVGWQVSALASALTAGENILLAGPTGTGKTYALNQVMRSADYTMVSIEGKEGLTDLDFLGAILPQPDGTRRWIDGPLLRAMRLAEADQVLLFLDEVNRIPRVHLNLLLGMMTPKDGETCRKMGLDVSGSGPFYVIEAPLTSEIVFCPVHHLRIAAAGNFGRVYQVYDLDPAVRRRFDTVIEFDYLEYRDEMGLVLREIPEISIRVAEGLVRVAQETRRLMANGELPGCVDTASLLNWARKCDRKGAVSVQAVFDQARLTWVDTVCGRDHTGRVNGANLQALQDYLNSLGVL
jgi:MoxR-like ATPase